MEAAHRATPAGWWQAGAARDRGQGAEGEIESAVPFWALMGFTFVLLISPQTFFPVLAPLRLALLAAVVSVTAHLFDRFIHGRPFTVVTRETCLVACLLVWAFVTVPFSYWPGGSLSFVLGVYLKSLAVFWLLSNTVTTLSRLRQVAWVLTLIAVPLSVTGVKNFLSGVFSPVVIESPGAHRIVGYEAPLTTNPNDLALILNLILPLAIALLLGAQTSGVRLLLLSVIGLIVSAVIATFSRAGFLTLATVVTMYLWKVRKRQQARWAWAVLGLALLSVPLLPPGYLDRLSTVANIHSDPTGSAQARWSDTVTSLRLVLANPVIGAGAGMNALALNEARGDLWKLVHNAYLEYAVDLAIPGVVLFVLLLDSCIQSTKFVQVRAPVGELFYLAEGIEISLVAFAVAAIFHPVGYLMNFYYFAGLAVAARLAYTRGSATHHVW